MAFVGAGFSPAPHASGKGGPKGRPYTVSFSPAPHASSYFHGGTHGFAGRFLRFHSIVPDPEKG